MDKNTDIFAGLKELGFDNIQDVDIYGKKEKEKEQEKEIKENIEIDERIYLYDKEVFCPVCENKFKVRAVKTNAHRMKNKDSDFHVNYSLINPYFYDVWLCNSCGYASTKADFGKLRDSEIELVQKNISTKWSGKKYAEIYDANVAIERYKLALLNHVVIGSKASKKAMNCLKIAWIYRTLEDTDNEQIFIKQALSGFDDAYFNEEFPIYGMHKFTILYLIGELNRRIGNNEEALMQFSKVITSQNAGVKLKDLARDQKDLLRETLNNNKKEIVPEVEKIKKKSSFISRLFK